MSKRILRVLRAAIGLVLFFPAMCLCPITYILTGKTFVEECVALIVCENGLR